jgi:hypothetical protein
MELQPLPQDVYAYAGLEPYASPKNRVEAMHITMHYQRAKDALIDLMVSEEVQTSPVSEAPTSVTIGANEQASYIDRSSSQ